MAFRFKQSEPVEAGLRRVASEQIAKALAELDDQRLSQAVQVHQVRKRCKKLRGLLRLVRHELGDAYQRENAWLRDTARLLSPLRDAKTSLQTFDAVIEPLETPDQQLAAIRRRLEDDAGEFTADQQQVQSQLQTVRERLVELKKRARQWSLGADEFKGVQRGVQKTYADARKRMRRAMEDPSADALHAWRKQVKYHGYQCRLLEALWPQLMKARSSEASRLGDWLGEDHDLAVVSNQLYQLPKQKGDRDMFNRIDRLIDRRRKKLQRKSWDLGKRLFAEGKKPFIRRYAQYWEAWRGH